MSTHVRRTALAESELYEGVQSIRGAHQTGHEGEVQRPARGVGGSAID